MAIWGLGTIGLAAACGAKAKGALKIIGVDLNEDKFKLAEQFGITDFVNPSKVESVPDAIRKLTGGVGVDYALEAIGLQSTAQAAFDSCAIWGRTILIGVISNGKVLEIPAEPLVMGRTLTGGFFGGYHGRNDIPKIIEQYKTGDLPVDKFITGTLPLDRVQEAFDNLLAGKALRTVILS